MGNDVASTPIGAPSLSRRERRARVERALVALGCALVTVLAYQVGRRVAFPWDLYIWSESPFMTNMLKLSHGASVFDGAADANSFVYSPGLEYVCFALLRPFGAQLDVRACRAVTIAFGLVAAYFCARSGSLVLSLMGTSDRDRDGSNRRFVPFAFACTTLLVFRSFTADVCHPDNLYLAHTSASFYLCLRAASNASFRGALVAVVVAALGVLTKQTAAFGVVGVTAVLVFLHRERWSRARLLTLVATAASFWFGATALLLSSENSRFFLFELLSHHEVAPYRVGELFHSYPHRFVLLGAAAFALFRLLGGRERGAALVFACWIAMGTEVLPAFASYVKAMGAWNNLTILDLWLSMITVPVLWRAGVTEATCAGALGLLVLLLVPLKMPATRGQVAFCTTLENAVAADLRAGRSVLLPHGTMMLLHAGATAIPMDRSNSFLELRMAGLERLAGTKARIEQRRYDRIYLFVSDSYGPETLQAIERNYHETAVIPADHTFPPTDELLAGHNGYLRTAVRVMAAN